MSAFENATKLFHACESGKGWDGCQAYVADNAVFSGQCEPLVDIKTVQAYTDWMAGLANVVMPGSSYELHASAFDNNTNTALFFATYTGKHTGEGGPVPPTNKEASGEYVYAITMDENNKAKHMTKVWNASWTMRALGWI